MKAFSPPYCHLQGFPLVANTPILPPICDLWARRPYRNQSPRHLGTILEVLWGSPRAKRVAFRRLFKVLPVCGSSATCCCLGERYPLVIQQFAIENGHRNS